MATRIERRRSKKKRACYLLLFVGIVIAAGVVFGYLCAQL